MSRLNPQKQKFNCIGRGIRDMRADWKQGLASTIKVKTNLEQGLGFPNEMERMYQWMNAKTKGLAHFSSNSYQASINDWTGLSPLIKFYKGRMAEGKWEQINHTDWFFKSSCLRRLRRKGKALGDINGNIDSKSFHSEECITKYLVLFIRANY